MKEKKIRIFVLEDGRIVIDDLPVKKGQQIEVIVKLTEPTPRTMPLRGLPVRLYDPFLPAVNESDWDAER